MPLKVYSNSLFSLVLFRTRKANLIPRDLVPIGSYKSQKSQNREPERQLYLAERELAKKYSNQKGNYVKKKVAFFCYNSEKAGKLLVISVSHFIFSFWMKKNLTSVNCPTIPGRLWHFKNFAALPLNSFPRGKHIADNKHLTRCNFCVCRLLYLLLFLSRL